MQQVFFNAHIYTKQKINLWPYLSEKVICSKNDEIVTEIYLKTLETKKIHKSNTCNLVKNIKCTTRSNATI